MVRDKVLVSDFDGTITQYDFYQLAIEQLLPAQTPNHWSEYLAGRITHFEGLRRYFADIRASHQEVVDVVAQMQPDPGLKQSLEQLRAAGWEVIIASAGCEWYIGRLLKEAEVDIEVHANPGAWVEGQGLQMHEPKQSVYYSAELGIDKAKIVRTLLEQGKTVAYAGDGLPDISPAKLVPTYLRFARGALAESLRSEGLGYQAYTRWSDIAKALVHR